MPPSSQRVVAGAAGSIARASEYGAVTAQDVDAIRHAVKSAA